jgi:acetyltransferase
MDAALLPFFAPRGIVVVGASADSAKLGHGVARNLSACGFPNPIHFVNPAGGPLLGRTVHRAVASVPDPVDLAVLVLPARAVPAALSACAERGIRAAIIASSGFREVGPEGAALESECVRVAREHTIRFMGPNCVGVLDTRLPLDTTFLPPPPPRPGEIAFLSQSGATCSAVIDWANGHGIGLSRLVSVGNEADLTTTDFLGPLAEDPHTRVIALYLEGLGQGRRFVELAREVARTKPIIALKAGRTAGGRRAVVSHTGALAGEDRAVDAAFRRSRVIRAGTSEELLDWACALAWCPLPEGRAMAVLTNAGGPGVLAADALEANGLTLAELAVATRDALRDLLPSAASVGNPVDMLASASPQQFATALRFLLADRNVQGVLVVIPPPPAHAAEVVAEALVPIARAAAKPIAIALAGECLVRRAGDVFAAAHIPAYRFPERAASALAVLTRRAEMLARPDDEPLRLDDVQPEVVRAVLRRAVVPGAGASAAGDLPDSAVAACLLAGYGIRVAPLELARDAERAVALAEAMGYPVALKVASPDMPHKSDVGGVRLGLTGAAAVADAFADVVRGARASRADARVLGVYVQPMVSGGQELIVGAVRDPQFGPLVMAGAGGLEVEAAGDVAFALAPLGREEAGDLLDRTMAGRRLRGFRSVPPADRAAAIEAVVRLAQLAADFAEIAEVEINPLLVLPEGQGAVAVDVRVCLA